MREKHTPVGLPPVEKSVTVDWSLEEAFRRFTEEISSWWPMATHSVAQEATEAVVFEGIVGGRIFERHQDGSTATWGKVRVWEPPHRVVFTWHPGAEPESAQEVELRFVATAEGTRMHLSHRGWGRLGERARESRAEYDQGWEGVLQRFLDRRR